MSHAPMPKTNTPGIYKRGSKYVVVYYADGRQRKESAPNMTAARRLKRARQADADRGELQAACTITLLQYLLAWIERYQGTGRRGFREETRNEYRGLLRKYALRYFPASLRLTALDPPRVAAFVAWLVEQPSRRGGTLSDNTIRNAITPLRAALATARREGLIRHNPVADVALPFHERVEEDDDQPRPFPDDTMELVVALVHPGHRVMFELLAATGVRRSELLALLISHLELDGASPHVKVRQRVRRRKGEGLVIGPLFTALAGSGRLRWGLCHQGWAFMARCIAGRSVAVVARCPPGGGGCGDGLGRGAGAPRSVIDPGWRRSRVIGGRRAGGNRAHLPRRTGRCCHGWPAAWARMKVAPPGAPRAEARQEPASSRASSTISRTPNPVAPLSAKYGMRTS